MRVLVVEDDVQCGASLAELLTLWGYDVQKASDTIEALEGILCFQPAVVISEAHLPRLGGIDLLRALRSYPLAPKFILMSGEVSFEERDAAVQFGAFDFMEKPLDFEKLRADLKGCQGRSTPGMDELERCPAVPDEVQECLIGVPERAERNRGEAETNI